MDYTEDFRKSAEQNVQDLAFFDYPAPYDYSATWTSVPPFLTSNALCTSTNDGLFSNTLSIPVRETFTSSLVSDVLQDIYLGSGQGGNAVNANMQIPETQGAILQESVTEVAASRMTPIHPTVESYVCLVCGYETQYAWDLRDHAALESHATFRCHVQPCDFQYIRMKDVRQHLKEMHAHLLTCEECEYVGRSRFELALHASSSGHASFICVNDDCEKKFSRLDTFQRHLKTHQDDAKRFPCKHCKKYRGQNGFKRKDHLTQHLRNYHRIGQDEASGSLYGRAFCPMKGCTMSQPASTNYRDKLFNTSAEWVKHMRTVHNESDFPCPRPGCDRVEGKGYYRKADLRAHLRKVHGMDGALEGHGI